MKILTALALAAISLASAGIEVRDATFPADEIPATNPRIVRAGGRVTHIEVFGEFTYAEDGSASAKVAETACDMDAVAAQEWVREAKTALGLATPKKYSRIKLEIAVARLGKYPALEAFLASQEIAPGYTALTAWKSAQVIQDDFEGFETYKAAVLQALEIDSATADAIMAECLAD